MQFPGFDRNNLIKPHSGQRFPVSGKNLRDRFFVRPSAETAVGRDHIGWSNLPSKQSIFFRGKSQTAMRISNPNRATHTYRQHLLAAPSKVFPLLCPVRETEWADGWLPEVVISVSGVAERDCVFLTPDKLGTAFWYTTRHEPEQWSLEMVKILPGVTACRLNIQLSEADFGCAADVTYTHTSLGPAGDELVAGFTAEFYLHFMQSWERALNHFLTTGCLLRDENAA